MFTDDEQLCRAFDLPPSDISISYKTVDKEGKVGWSPLLSDWDLDTAILGSADQDLSLQVALMEAGPPDEASAREGMTPVVEVGQTIVKELEPVSKSLKAGVEQVNQAGAGIQGLVSKSSNQASGFFRRHYQTTLPGLTSKFKAALNLDMEEKQTEPGETYITSSSGVFIGFNNE